MKRFTALLVALIVFATLFASCGNIIVKTGNKGDDKEDEKEKETTSADVEEETTEAEGEDITEFLDDTTVAPETKAEGGVVTDFIDDITVAPETEAEGETEVPETAVNEYTPGYMKNGSFVNPWSNIKYTPANGEVIGPDDEDYELLHYDMTGYCYGDDGYYEVCLWYREMEGLDYETVVEYMLDVWSEDYWIDDDFVARVAGNTYEGYEMYANDYSHGMTILMRECYDYVEMIVIYVEAEMDIDPIFDRFSKYK